MGEGRFERISIGMVAVVIIVFGVITWSNSLFDKYSVTSMAGDSFTFLDEVNSLNNTLNIMYTNTSQSQNFNILGLGLTLTAGWQVIGLVFNIIGLFLFLPYQLCVMAIPDTTTAVWLGGLLNVLYLAFIVWGFAGIALSRKQGSI